jgi:hypothetical protein
LYDESGRAGRPSAGLMTGARERNFAPDLSAPLCLAKYRLPDPGQFDILASDPAWWRIGCNSINYIGAS